MAVEISNVSIKVDGDDVLIRIKDAGKLEGKASQSGKTKLVGSTSGFVPVSGFKSNDDRVVKVSLNATI